MRSQHVFPAGAAVTSRRSGRSTGTFLDPILPARLYTRSAAAPLNSTAFWIIDVDQAVIEDHGDIWNTSFVEMLGQLMAPRGFFDPELGRVKIASR